MINGTARDAATHAPAARAAIDILKLHNNERVQFLFQGPVLLGSLMT